MSTPPPEDGRPDDGTPPEPEAPLDFDPYRFGAPEHPVPPEYAPPGYVPPVTLQKPPPDPSTAYPPPNASPYPPPGYQAPGPQGPGYQGPDYTAGPNPSGQGPYGQYGPGPYGQYPQGPYGQQQGYPPIPPNYNQQYPAPSTGNGRAIASLVLGIVSIPLCFFSIFDLIPIGLAITFGIIGRRAATVNPRLGGKGMATAGIACAAVGAVLAIVLTVVLSRAISHCNEYNQGSSEWNTCVQHYLHLK